MKKRKMCIGFALFFVFFITFVFFVKTNYKKINLGNNKNNKSANEVRDYILNINSYTAEFELIVNSNKNTNKYVIKQKYIKDKVEKQTVIKPENIEGTEISYKDGNIEISSSRLNLSKIYNNYPYLSDNVIWLKSFVENCKNNSDKLQVYDENEYVVMELELNNNRYLKNRKLYLEKGTGKPKKMIVQDDNKKDIIYIVYKEIEINNN